MIAHESIIDELVGSTALSVFGRLPIGDPFAERNARRPADQRAGVQRHGRSARAGARPTAASCWSAADAAESPAHPDAYYVEPALVRMPAQTEVVRRETFAPILYVMSYSRPVGGDRASQRRPPGPVLEHLHPRPARSGALPRRRRLRLRHRQRQHRHLRRRDRRSIRRREVHRRRPRVRLRRVARLHAPGDEQHQLLRRAAAGAGREVRVSA